MGFGRVIAAAVAAAPVVREQLRRVYPGGEDRNEREHTLAAAASALPRRTSDSSLESDRYAEDMARRPLIAVDTHGPSRPSHIPVQTYGTISSESPSTLRASPERYRRDSWLDRVPEETTMEAEEEGTDQERDEWDLAEYGYYSGSYHRKVAVYGLVPLTCIVTFLLLANLVRWIWPPRYPATPTLPRSFPSPLPEVLLSTAFYSFTHALRVPLYNAATALFPPGWNTLAFNTAYVLLSQVLRLAALALLRVRHEMLYPLPTWHDPAFATAWWLALGWAVADAATSVTQGYRQLALYSNVMVPEERVREILAVSKAAVMTERSASGGSAHDSREYMPLSPRSEREAAGTEGTATPKANGSRSRRAPVSVEEAVRMAVDQDVEQLMHLQEREELEEVYGMPVIYIPVFVPCLQRIDSFLFSLGFTLVLAWAYLRSPLSFPIGTDPLPSIYSNRALGIAFPVVVLAHLFLSLLHSPPVLPRIGVHTTAYVGLLVGLGGFFTGLGLWGALS